MPQQTPTVATSRRRIVLVVHRAPREAARLATLLEAAGDVVMVATDGPAALELARRLQPDAIVLDLALDHRDGIALGWHLRADAATAHLPLIGLSPSRCLRQPASRMTVDALVAHPLTEAALGAALAPWVERQTGTAQRPD